MSDWDVNLYSQFRNERTQPAIDLISRILTTDPKKIIDLGCGPGNSTEILRQRWPQASITGLDSSPEMIISSRKNYPDQEWILADAAEWQPSSAYDIVFSNAAFQWIPQHNLFLNRLFGFVAAGGVLAFQIPAHICSPLHQRIVEVSNEQEWAHLMEGPQNALTIESPSYYYNALINTASKLEIWETEYCHVMDSSQAIVSWIASTGLRPFLEALENELQKQRFVRILGEQVEKTYSPQKNGKVLFPFRRLFVVAYR